MAIISVIVIGFVFKEQFMGIFSSVLSYRGDSNSTRMMIYTKSINKFLAESPIWGCGIKEVISGTGLPYGSHSTYLGMFYKTGIVGGVLYLLATAIAVVKLIIQKDNTKFKIRITFCFLIIFALMILEDLDGANWNIVIFMSLFAMNFRNKLKEQ